MSKVQATVVFDNTFRGELVTDRARVAIGSGADEVYPYDMLQGALASCLYATFLDVMVKKKAAFEGVRFEIEGIKRSEIPTTLEWVKIRFLVKGATDESAVLKSFDLAVKYCSIFQTISRVADMEWEVVFE